MLAISGKIIVFVNEAKETKNKFFTTTISSKKEDGEYENLSMIVRFVGDLKSKAAKLDPKYRYTVNVEDSFLSHFNQKVELVIKSATIESKVENKKPEPKKETKKPKKTKEKIDEYDDDLPF